MTGTMSFASITISLSISSGVTPEYLETLMNQTDG
jgi:hypothetical protein